MWAKYRFPPSRKATPREVVVIGPYNRQGRVPSARVMLDGVEYVVPLKTLFHDPECAMPVLSLPDGRGERELRRDVDAMIPLAAESIDAFETARRRLGLTRREAFIVAVQLLQERTM